MENSEKISNDSFWKNENNLRKLKKSLKQMEEGKCSEHPNKEFLEAIKEADDIIAHPEKYKGYNSVEELFEDLNS